MNNQDSFANLLQPLQEILTEFAPIPSLIGKVAPEDRPYETLQMRQGAAYSLLEQLIAPINVVWTPPKVAGQTIAATLWAHPTLPKPKHIHFMSPKGLAFIDWLIENSHHHPNQHMWHSLMAHGRWVRVMLAANRFLRANGLASVVPKPILISGVREPMAQYLSLVFQVWWMYVKSPADLNAESIRAQMRDDPWRHQCNNWFKDDLAEMTGIDVFSRPFPTEQGWDIYENDVARVLIIRQENLDRLPQAIGTLYGIDPATVKLESRNKAEEKEYFSHYDAVKKAWSPTDQDIAEVYSPRFVSHFYTAHEIDNYQQRWRKKAGATSRETPPETYKKQQAGEKVPAKPKSESPCGHQSSNVPTAHDWACHPCPQCALELNSLKDQAKAIDRLKAYWPVKLLLKGRKLLRRMSLGQRMTK